MSLIIRTTGAEDFLDGGTAHIKALIMGAPSAGKTRSASFWPKPIFADCEKGRMSIADRRVPYAEILSTEDMDDLLARLKRECKKAPGDRAYQTLVIDTLDAYQRIVIQERLDSEQKQSLSGWADWGYLDGKLTQFIAKLHGLPMNIVVNVHVKDSSTGDDDDKITTTGVKLKGDIKDQIAADFDLVGFMGTYWEAVDGERKLMRGIQWHPDPSKPVLKDRSGSLPKWTQVVFGDEDYATIFGAVTSTMDALSDSTVVETIETENTVAPVAPSKGGPVASAPLTPPATPRKAVPAKAAAKDTPAAAKDTSSDTRAAVLQGPDAAATPAGGPGAAVETPTAVGVPAATRPPVPSAPKPTIAGATSEPEAPAPAAAPEPAAAPAEAAQAPAEEPVTHEQGVEAAQQALGGEVTSDSAAVDQTTTAAPEAPVAEEAAVASEAITEAPLCGTSSNEGEEGQPGKVPGCGQPVDPDVDFTQIGVFKYRTYLCADDYQNAKNGATAPTPA